MQEECNAIIYHTIIWVLHGICLFCIYMAVYELSGPILGREVEGWRGIAVGLLVVWLSVWPGGSQGGNPIGKVLVIWIYGVQKTKQNSVNNQCYSNCVEFCGILFHSTLNHNVDKREQPICRWMTVILFITCTTKGKSAAIIGWRWSV